MLQYPNEENLMRLL